MTKDEIQQRINLAKDLGCNSITVEGVTYSWPSYEPKAISSEVSDDVLIKQVDEYTDQEILYWSTPFFDELQAKKKEQQSKSQEEESFKKSLQE